MKVCSCTEQPVCSDMLWLGELIQKRFTDEFLNAQVSPQSFHLGHRVWGCCKTSRQNSKTGRVFWCCQSFPRQVPPIDIIFMDSFDPTILGTLVYQMSCSNCVSKNFTFLLVQPHWPGCHHHLPGWPPQSPARGSPSSSERICWLGIKVSHNAELCLSLT